MAVLFAPLAAHLDLHVPRRPKADDADQDRVHHHEPPDEEGVRLDLFHGCQMAKFDPFLSLDCARVEGAGAQSKERKGSKFAA